MVIAVLYHQSPTEPQEALNLSHGSNLCEESSCSRVLLEGPLEPLVALSPSLCFNGLSEDVHVYSLVLLVVAVPSYLTTCPSFLSRLKLAIVVKDSTRNRPQCIRVEPPKVSRQSLIVIFTLTLKVGTVPPELKERP